MKRTLLIARREFAAYAKTVGFWLSLLAFPLFAVLGGAVPLLMKSSEPVREVVVLDEGPQATGLAASVQTALEQERERRDQRRREAEAGAGAAGGQTGAAAAGAAVCGCASSPRPPIWPPPPPGRRARNWPAAIWATRLPRTSNWTPWSFSTASRASPAPASGRAARPTTRSRSSSSGP